MERAGLNEGSAAAIIGDLESTAAEESNIDKAFTKEASRQKSCSDRFQAF